jgi:hypothetical protein
VTTAEPLRVVLGEAEPSGVLRFVLQGEGFHLVGMAACDDDVRRVLAGARPSAIVLDAGISAPVALEIRERYPDVPLVLVWPPGVAAVLADEHVDPAEVVTELGSAVRRAAARAAARNALDAVRPAEHVGTRAFVVDVVRITAPVQAPRPLPRRRMVSHPTAFVVAVALLNLLLGATIALGVPFAVDHILQRPDRRGSPAHVVDQPRAQTVSPTPGPQARARSHVARPTAPAPERGIRAPRPTGHPNTPGTSGHPTEPAHAGGGPSATSSSR